MNLVICLNYQNNPLNKYHSGETSLFFQIILKREWIDYRSKLEFYMRELYQWITLLYNNVRNMFRDTTLTLRNHMRHCNGLCWSLWREILNQSVFRENSHIVWLLRGNVRRIIFVGLTLGLTVERVNSSHLFKSEDLQWIFDTIIIIFVKPYYNIMELQLIDSSEKYYHNCNLIIIMQHEFSP